MEYKDLWLEYYATDDIKVRNKLVDLYYHLVISVVGMIQARMSYGTDDMFSYGSFGLLDAVEKFDLKKGVPFPSYAKIRISGAVFDWMRRESVVPRGILRWRQMLDQTRKELEHEFKEEIQESMIFDKLGLSDKIYKKNITFNITDTMSLEGADEEGLGAIDIISNKSENIPTRGLDAVDFFKKITKDLTNFEKELIFQRFFNRKNYHELEQNFDYGSSALSMHSKAILNKLQKTVLDNNDYFNFHPTQENKNKKIKKEVL